MAPRNSTFSSQIFLTVQSPNHCRYCFFFALFEAYAYFNSGFGLIAGCKFQVLKVRFWVLY